MKSFESIVGKELVCFLENHAVRKVRSRVDKAEDHYKKAVKLGGVDEEMAMLRLIAAEEELVVAIFELLKLKEDKVPEHRDFVKKFKNHQVKLAFYPVLSQFGGILEGFPKGGAAFEGLENMVGFEVAPIINGDTIELEFTTKNGEKILRHSPLSIAISLGDKSASEVIDEMFSDFSEHLKGESKTTVKQFVSDRANFRNKLLYAEDAGFAELSDGLTDWLPMFDQATHQLLWALAVLLGNDADNKEWGLVSQFIALYGKVLVESNILKPAEA